MMRLLAVLGGAALFGGQALALTHCAESTCKFNSECGGGLCVQGHCERQCIKDIDCPSDRPFCAAGICSQTRGDAAVDASVAPPADAGGDTSGPAMDLSIAPDLSVPPDLWVVETAVDAPVVIEVSLPPAEVSSSTKGYLDSCKSDSECTSGTCTSASPRFCTQSCLAHSDCANGQICAAGRCRIDDVGFPSCDPKTGSPCLEFCYGTSSTTHCTHSCSSAAECPAGYACSTVATGKRVCVNIERPCSTADQCPSGFGFCASGNSGCTALCDTAADCPYRLVGLLPYTCELTGGNKVCMPPSDGLGSDPLGAVCSPTMSAKCRSAVCDDGTTPPTCNQRCTARGGCPSGWGCLPLIDGGDVHLVCNAAGSTGWLGETCTRGRDCVTGLCDGTAPPYYCTRLCIDNLCPTGMYCRNTGVTAKDGTLVKLCTKL